jgi:hypothetical protein
MGLTLQESARIIGHYRWVEMRLFEILGAWVPEVPEVEAKLVVAAHSPHHAWHSLLWLERLPELAGVDRHELTVPANDHVVAVMDGLHRSDRTIEKLAGVYRVVLPRMIAAYRGHLARASAVTDAPTIRALKLVLRDEVDDWMQGEALIQSLLIDDLCVQRAAQHQARLEAMMVAAGAISGEAPGP